MLAFLKRIFTTPSPGTILGVHVATGSRDGYGLVAPHCRGIVSFLTDAFLEADDDTYTVFRPNEEHGIYEYEGIYDGDIMPGFNELTVEDMPGQAAYWWPKILAAVESEELRLDIRIAAIQPRNEADSDEREVNEKLIAYEQALLPLAEQAGRTLVVGSLSTNSPHWGNGLWQELWAPFIREAWERGHIYGRHSYFDYPPEEDHKLRPFWEIDYLRTLGPTGPVIISEVGFVTFPGIDAFMDAIIAYDQLLQDYPEIGYAAIFTYGEWWNANIEAASARLSEYLKANPFTKWEPETPEPPPPPPDDELEERVAALESQVATLTAQSTNHESRIAFLESQTHEHYGDGDKPPPDPNRTPIGVDVSRWQGFGINWQVLKEQDDIEFAYIRAGSGLTPQDDNYTYNWTNAVAAGIIPGAYWYLYPDSVKAAETQAREFAALLRDDYQLPPMCDVEQTGLNADMVQRFCEELERQSGRRAGIYTGMWFWEPMSGDKSFADVHPLWIARYGVDNPNVPFPWLDYYFHQFTSTGDVTGYEGNIDMNRFNGTFAELLQLVDWLVDTPPNGDALDMASYFVPENGTAGPIYTMANNWGAGNERVQLQYDGGYSYVTKNQQYERRRIEDDGIYLELDTSPGDNQYYTVSGGAWLPRHWRIGETFTRSEHVEFFNKGDCSPVANKPPYDFTSDMRLLEHYDMLEINGIQLDDVVIFEWIVNNVWDERHTYAAGLGLVRWEKADGKRSEITELIPLGDQEDNVRETGCFSG